VKPSYNIALGREKFLKLLSLPNVGEIMKLLEWILKSICVVMHWFVLEIWQTLQENGKAQFKNTKTQQVSHLCGEAPNIGL
jgi:hypothetical protein